MRERQAGGWAPVWTEVPFPEDVVRVMQLGDVLGAQGLRLHWKLKSGGQHWVTLGTQAESLIKEGKKGETRAEAQAGEG